MTYIFKHKEQTAKAQHVCTWCGEEIEVGERYYYQAGTYYSGN